MGRAGPRGFAVLLCLSSFVATQHVGCAHSMRQSQSGDGCQVSAPSRDARTNSALSSLLELARQRRGSAPVLSATLAAKVAKVKEDPDKGLVFLVSCDYAKLLAARTVKYAMQMSLAAQAEAALSAMTGPLSGNIEIPVVPLSPLLTEQDEGLRVCAGINEFMEYFSAKPEPSRPMPFELLKRVVAEGNYTKPKDPGVLGRIVVNSTDSLLAREQVAFAAGYLEGYLGFPDMVAALKGKSAGALGPALLQMELMVAIANIKRLMPGAEGRFWDNILVRTRQYQGIHIGTQEASGGIGIPQPLIFSGADSKGNMLPRAKIHFPPPPDSE